MRKTTAIILALILALVLVGCSADKLEEKINSVADNIEAGFDSMEEKLDGTEGEPEEAPTEEPEQTPAEESQQAPAADGIRPEIKEAIDSYEEFFKEYADFMASYDATDASALAEYLSMLGQYTETMQKLDDMEDKDLTDEETVYLTQATLRIDQMLLDVAG